MQIHYDSATDVLMIRLRESEIAESDEVSPGMIVDFDPEGVPVAIEILNARRVLNPDGTLTVQLTPPMPANTAA